MNTSEMTANGSRKSKSGLNRIYLFFTLFCFVYFLESIGGIYMVVMLVGLFAVVSMLNISMDALRAINSGYIPTVIVISYMGSKGNRARWIGGGCLLIAFANLLIATPNFLFPVTRPQIGFATIRRRFSPPVGLLQDDVTIDQLLDWTPIANSISLMLKQRLLNGSATDTKDVLPVLFGYMSDDPLVSASTSSSFLAYLKAFVQEKHRLGPNISVIRKAHDSAASPLTICDSVINELKSFMGLVKCADGPTNTGPFAVIFGALFLLGIGRTMPWSLGVPLIDDNVKRKNLPVYFAGMFFIRILGPIFGFLIGSLCNRLYYTLQAPEGLSPRDPTWIGAWWLGFLVISAILAGPSLGLFCFPNPMKIDDEPDVGSKDEKSLYFVNQTQKRTKRRSLALVDRYIEKEEHGHAVIPEGVSAKIRDLKKSIGMILKSPIYTGALIGRILEVLAFKGYMVFLPKFLENHYGIPQYQVHICLAIFGVFGFAVGMISGSVLMRRLKLEGRRAALFVAVCSLLSGLVSFSKVSLGCHSVINNVGLVGESVDFNFTTTCNSGCFCDSVPLFPVCDRDGNVYYSPCHAGCPYYTFYAFANCECSKSGSIVKHDWCRDDCSQMMVIYFILIIISGILGGLGVIPGILIILRSVPPAHRSISLGFSGFLVSLLATLPSPVIWGVIIDSACLLWQKTCSGLSGSCAIYEPTLLRTRMHIFCGLLRAVAFLFDIWVWYFAKDLKLITSQDENESECSQNDENVDQLQLLTVGSEANDFAM